MPSSPVGAIAIAKDLLKTSIATTTAFRTWEGNNWTIDQAKARIYFDALPPPASNANSHSLAELNTYRPFCLIYRPEELAALVMTQVANGSHNKFVPSGVLIAHFERNVPEAQLNDPGEASRTFENFIGALIQSGDTNNPGLVELAGNAGYLNIRKIHDDGPYRSASDEIPGFGDCQVYRLIIEWGVRP